jgi:DNA-binding winged helix-turn-helix (wHTH) protein
MTSTRLQERIDHLEHCLREITTPAADVIGDLSPYRSRLLGALLNASGRPVSYSGLMAAMYWDRPDCDWPDGEKVLHAQIHYLRRDLKASGSPIEVQTVWGRGYRVDPKAAE